MRRIRRYLPIALVVGLALPLIGCPLIVLKICVTNSTPFDIVEMNISPQSALGWGPNVLAAPIVAGGSLCMPDIEPDTYDIRARFDVKITKGPVPEGPDLFQQLWCHDYGVAMTTLNLALTYLWAGGLQVYSTQSWYL